MFATVKKSRSEPTQYPRTAHKGGGRGPYGDPGPPPNVEEMNQQPLASPARNPETDPLTEEMNQQRLASLAGGRGGAAPNCD